MIQAYVDESGGKNQSPLFLFSALIGEAMMWATVADQWDACLKAEPSIRYLKMDEAAGLDGEFRGFLRQERDKKIASLCRVINLPEITELHACLVLADFESLWAPVLGRPACEPYFFPFQTINAAVGFEALSRNESQPAEVFYDENKIFGPRAKAWYPVIRELFPPEVQAVMPVEPFFRSDRDVLPLQAADMTAWLLRNTSNRTGLGEFEWMIESLRQMSGSRLSKIVDADWIKKMFAAENYSPEEVARQQNALRVYRETFGHDWPPKTKVERKRHRGYVKKP